MESPNSGFEWFQHLNQILPAYIYAPVVFVLWVLFFWFLKRLLFHRLKRWALKTTQAWDDIIVESVSFPTNFLIFASGLTVFTNLLPLPEKMDRFATIALQGSVIFAIVFFFDHLTRLAADRYASKMVFAQVSGSITKGVLRGFILGMGALIFLDLIGISITPILASLGIGSLAVALGLQDTLANFFAGIYVSIDQPIRVGDFVKLESGEEGYVTDVGWRSTRIRTLPNHVVIVPNSKIIGSIITNYYLPDKEVAVLVQVGVHYDSDLKQVERVTAEVGKEVLKNVQGAVSTFDPFIRYHTFGDSSINFTVILRAKEFVDNYLIKHEFIKAIHERYKQEGIIIPFPIRTIELSENSVKYLKKP